LPAWLRYDAANRSTMLLDEESRVEDVPRAICAGYGTDCCKRKELGMKRVFGVLLCGLAFVAGACSSGGPKGAQAYKVFADQASPAGKNFQFSAFYPTALKVRPGDSITFQNRGTGAPHTITFGVAADRSNQPPPADPRGENPAVFFNCFTAKPPTKTMFGCPTKSGATPPEYTGSGYWNAFFVPVPDPSGPKQITMKLSSSISPGSYRFICILHPPMVGTIQVVGSDGDREAVENVAQDVVLQSTAAQTAADKIANPPITSSTIAAGWSGGPVAVNRFYPKQLSVKRGTKVTWKDFSPFEPHTITFGVEPPRGGSPAAYFQPSGVKSGGSYMSGLANSGIFGGDISKTDYSLVFTTPGDYTYACMLHPGMVGAVKVT
jgi:plastocyanin